MDVWASQPDISSNNNDTTHVDRVKWPCPRFVPNVTTIRAALGAVCPMNKALEQKMVERWPTWFNIGGDIRYTLIPRGSTHDDGWFDILWRLCEDLEPLVTETERQADASSKCCK